MLGCPAWQRPWMTFSLKRLPGIQTALRCSRSGDSYLAEIKPRCYKIRDADPWTHHRHRAKAPNWFFLPVIAWPTQRADPFQRAEVKCCYLDLVTNWWPSALWLQWMAAGHCLSLLNKQHTPIKLTVITVFIVASSLLLHFLTSFSFSSLRKKSFTFTEHGINWDYEITQDWTCSNQFSWFSVG